MCFHVCWCRSDSGGHFIVCLHYKCVRGQCRDALQSVNELVFYKVVSYMNKTPNKFSVEVMTVILGHSVTPATQRCLQRLEFYTEMPPWVCTENGVMGNCRSQRSQQTPLQKLNNMSCGPQHQRSQLVVKTQQINKYKRNSLTKCMSAYVSGLSSLCQSLEIKGEATNKTGSMNKMDQHDSISKLLSRNQSEGGRIGLFFSRTQEEEKPKRRKKKNH